MSWHSAGAGSICEVQRPLAGRGGDDLTQPFMIFFCCWGEGAGGGLGGGGDQRMPKKVYHELHCDVQAVDILRAMSPASASALGNPFPHAHDFLERQGAQNSRPLYSKVKSSPQIEATGLPGTPRWAVVIGRPPADLPPPAVLCLLSCAMRRRLTSAGSSRRGQCQAEHTSTHTHEYIYIYIHAYIPLCIHTCK